jgi:deoxyribodipyrimidine photo-lyase
MQSFHQERGELYRSAMSSPIGGETACSRLSPYLAFGTISLREVAQATQQRQAELKLLEGDKPKNWRASMASFTKRLHWRSHFMQKLESEPRLEFQNLHPAYDGLRTSTSPDAARLAAWQKGETGLPFVDACMRYLAATGWLNFRMRAMLMSVASYHLWLHWREPGLHLARLFTDYEPGIHWPQTQMQSGTTGINTVRIYNPVKQGYDQDPKGEFVRRWVPELASLDSAEIHEPWKSQHASKLLDKTYPMPVVDYLEAARDARQRIYTTRKGKGFRDTAAKILSKHGSRKRRFPQKRGVTRESNTAATPHSEQLSLELTGMQRQDPD